MSIYKLITELLDEVSYHKVVASVKREKLKSYRKKEERKSLSPDKI